MGNRKVMGFFRNKGTSLPSKQKVFEKWDTYTEAIDPDSLSDAFEVENDCIDRIFNQLK